MMNLSSAQVFDVDLNTRQVHDCFLFILFFDYRLCVVGAAPDCVVGFVTVNCDGNLSSIVKLRGVLLPFGETRA